jgi:hypothetical protein
MRLDQEPCLEQVEDRPRLERSRIGVGEQDAPLRIADVDAGAVAQLDHPESLELPERLAHRRRGHRKSPRERLHRRQPVAPAERLVLDQCEHLLGDEAGDRGRRAVVATAGRHGYPGTHMVCTRGGTRCFDRSSHLDK